MAYTRYTSKPAQMISMMIGPEFIFASAHSLAEMNVSQRNPEEQNRYRKKDCILHHESLQPLSELQLPG
jgi:hypothetical protein